MRLKDGKKAAIAAAFLGIALASSAYGSETAAAESAALATAARVAE